MGENTDNNGGGNTTDQDALKAKVEAAGFKLNTAGKIIGDDGKLVSKAQSDQIMLGNIVQGISFDDIRKKKARSAASGGVDLLAGLREISPAIELLKVGQMARIEIPKKAEGAEKDPKRSFVMSIVTKLNNITVEGREWAGRYFETLADDEGSYVFVQRKPDGDARKRNPGGPRKKGDALSDALAKSRAHLAGVAQGEGNTVQTEDANDQQVGDAADNNQPIVSGDGQAAVLEDARVIQHT